LYETTAKQPPPGVSGLREILNAKFEILNKFETPIFKNLISCPFSIHREGRKRLNPSVVVK